MEKPKPKSFSIDALLARGKESSKEGENKRPKNLKVVNSCPVRVSSPHSSRPSSVDSLPVYTSDDGALSPSLSPHGGGEPRVSMPSFVPRPGMLHPSHPLQHHGHSNIPAAFHSILAVHPFYSLNNGQYHGQPGPLPMLAGSAFHPPSEQALKMLQPHQSASLEWWARQGILNQRVVEYAGTSIHCLLCTLWRRGRQVSYVGITSTAIGF